MPKVPFEMWLQQYETELDGLLGQIFKSLNMTYVPNDFKVDHAYFDDLRPALLEFIYDHSSSSHFIG
jgi:hypothetical protein